MRSVTTQFEQIVSTGKNVPPEAVVSILNIEEPGEMADQIAWHMPSLRVETKQEILETLDTQDAPGNDSACCSKKSSRSSRSRKTSAAGSRRRWARRSASSSCASR